MKGEERIVELLAEYLQKTDRLLDRMEKTDRNVEMMSTAIANHSVKFNEMKEEQGIMLKELLSISRRVSTLEDKP